MSSMSIILPLLLLLSPNGVLSTSLERTFGSLSRVATSRDRGATAAYLELRKECRYPLEIFILQESTLAFEDDFAEMQSRQLPDMISSLAGSHPNTTVSVGFFRDKPIAPYGSPTDYCQRLNKLTPEIDEVVAMYAMQTAEGGGDKLQNNLGALMAAAQSREIGWGGNELATKVIVHVTDSAPHFYDGSESGGLHPPRRDFAEERADEQCTREYYPSPNQSKAALLGLANLHVAHLLYDPDYLRGDVAQSWIWFNRYHGQPDEFVNLREKDSSDFWHKLQPIISRIDEIECRPNRTVALARTNPDCGRGSNYCKDGVYVQLGFRPDNLKVEVLR